MRKHNRLFQLKTSFVSAIASNTIATRLLVYEMASVAIGDAFIKQGHDGIAADMLRQKRLGGPLIGSYPNWFIAELRYSGTNRWKSMPRTVHDPCQDYRCITDKRDTDPSIRFQISEQCILPSAGPVCRQERRACDPKQRDRLPTPRKDSSESVPIGRRLCFKPAPASSFQIADSRLLHRQGALLRCPVYQQRSLRNLMRQPFVVLNIAHLITSSCP